MTSIMSKNCHWVEHVLMVTDHKNFVVCIISSPLDYLDFAHVIKKNVIITFHCVVPPIIRQITLLHLRNCIFINSTNSIFNYIIEHWAIRCIDVIRPSKIWTSWKKNMISMQIIRSFFSSEDMLCRVFYFCRIKSFREVVLYNDRVVGTESRFVFEYDDFMICRDQIVAVMFFWWTVRT